MKYTREQIIELRKQGLTIRAIQKQLGISSPSVVQYHLNYGKKALKSWIERGFVFPERKPRPGDREGELLCAGFNEYRRLVIESLEGGKYEHTCTRCGTSFRIKHELDENASPVCTPCFQHIISATSAADYYERRRKI